MAFLYSDPFESLFQFQNALDQLRSSNWLQASPSGGGGYPPMNVFRKGEDIVLIIEVPGVRKSDLRIEARETPSASPAPRQLTRPTRRACTASNAAAATSTAP